MPCEFFAEGSGPLFDALAEQFSFPSDAGIFGAACKVGACARCGDASEGFDCDKGEPVLLLSGGVARQEIDGNGYGAGFILFRVSPSFPHSSDQGREVGIPCEEKELRGGIEAGHIFFDGPATAADGFACVGK